MISLTKTAANKVKSIIDKKEQGEYWLKVGVRGGGCSGFTYFLEISDNKNSNDKEIVSNQIKMSIDPKSYLYLMGTEIDFVDSLEASGFKFNNPSAKRTCGCGESFSV